MVKFAVCDEREMISFIADRLRMYYPDECEIKTYTDGASLLSDCSFDALFLDADIPELNGMEIAKKIRKNDLQVKIIFVSGQDDLAYKGYLYDAFRFVRKSNLEQELCEAAKSLNEIFSMRTDCIVFKTATGETVIAAKDIKYLESKSHYIDVACNGGVVRAYGTLREYEERMGCVGFIRIHKSFLVNFRYIQTIVKNVVILTCGKKLPLSRYRADEARIKMKYFSKRLVT